MDESQSWGSFDISTNTPIVYPAPEAGTNQMTVRRWLTSPNFHDSFEWSPASPIGSGSAFQTSSNLSNWVTIFRVTNNGSVATYINYDPTSTSRFYRLFAQ
jgi:hypothetical protein